MRMAARKMAAAWGGRGSSSVRAWPPREHEGFERGRATGGGRWAAGTGRQGNNPGVARTHASWLATIHPAQSRPRLRGPQGPPREVAAPLAQPPPCRLPPSLSVSTCELQPLRPNDPGTLGLALAGQEGEEEPPGSSSRVVCGWRPRVVELVQAPS